MNEQNTDGLLLRTRGWVAWAGHCMVVTKGEVQKMWPRPKLSVAATEAECGRDRKKCGRDGNECGRDRKRVWPRRKRVWPRRKLARVHTIDVNSAGLCSNDRPDEIEEVQRLLHSDDGHIGRRHVEVQTF